MADPNLTSLQRSADRTIDARSVVAALRAMSWRASPRGRERALAERLARWSRLRWPDLDWQVDPVGRTGANLRCRSVRDVADELLIYSHLDTSLTGEGATDRAVTGIDTPPPRLVVDRRGDRLAGFGLGVARGPAAAALVGFAAASGAVRQARLPHQLTLLLASAGTHGSPYGPQGSDVPPSGLAHYLDTDRPAAAVVAKSGPAGILHEEPGAMFVRVTLRTRMRPVLARDQAAPAGGPLAHLGAVLRILERWRIDHVRTRRPGDRQMAAEAAVGAVHSGLAGKPDILPGIVELHLYVITASGDDPDRIRRDIHTRLVRGLANGPLADCAITVDRHVVQTAGRTAPDRPVVRHAHAAWRLTQQTPPAPISGWKGSTDGAALRAAGIDTARVGPRPGTDPQDPRVDVLAVSDLVRFARLYAHILLRHATVGRTAVDR
ncbi:hypothetical protein [Verrucosispora sp. TAA-831]|uniref:hypothetical protein n=1 Tax=Verrucosispora sp. TAA-831 TaxID=3422227 RepID=UPI003D6FF442